MGIPKTLGLIWLAKARVAEAATRKILGTSLLMASNNAMMGGTFFAVGSFVFSYLLLRGRVVPVALAWTGIVASALLVIFLPFTLAGFITGPFQWYIWLPMILFEVPLAGWLMIKGVRRLN